MDVGVKNNYGQMDASYLQLLEETNDFFSVPLKEMGYNISGEKLQSVLIQDKKIHGQTGPKKTSTTLQLMQTEKATSHFILSQKIDGDTGLKKKQEK